MSETDLTSPPDAPVEPLPEPAPVAEAPTESFAGPPMPYSAFAATLKPRRVPLVRAGRPVVQNGRTLMTATAGQPDEVWLKLLKIRHGGEKHTVQGWNALINAMRDEPAHPSDPRLA